MTRTIETLTENLDLIEARTRTLKTIAIESATDDGDWRTSLFSNEAAAFEFETNLRRRGVPTRRV